MPAHPPFDPEIAHALATRDDVVTSLLPDQIAALRARDARPPEHELTRDGALVLTEHEAPGPEGAAVPVLLLRPREADESAVLYFVHGGGLVVGTPYDDLPALADLAIDSGFALATVGYRLAPEHPYPDAVEDVYAGLEWLASTAAALRLDPTRIVIAGSSAGGGLAAAATLLARDRKGPPLLGQLLLYPMLDHRNDSESAVQMIGVGAWDRTANATGWAAYLGEIGDEDVTGYASPSRASDLSDLPATFIDLGAAETFRSEDIDYARRIWATGGDAELHVWSGGAHGFDSLAPASRVARDARATRATWLRRLAARVEREAP